ncbi:response regulator, partial [Bacillus cereus]|uniref:response regulator n=1 Tax=Bacillus cereus TaxID=1396 RepID=UPI0034D673F3|nr:response regulator [Bacillus cereus]
MLIVDDLYGIRVLLHEVFQKEGNQTLQAANGFQALDIVKKEKPELVVVDKKNPAND